MMADKFFGNCRSWKERSREGLSLRQTAPPFDFPFFSSLLLPA
jgi:hypothetical protein